MDAVKKLSFPNYTITWLKDNDDDMKNPTTLFPKATPPMLKLMGLEQGIPASVSTFLLECDNKKALFDTGFGDFKHKKGFTLKRLEFLNIKPDQIDFIFITHLHPDHILGLIDKDNQIVFKKAKVYIARDEFEGWMAMPEDKNALQRQILGIIKEQIILFEYEKELPMGIMPYDAKGHTPGHTVFKKNETIIVGDIIHGLALQLYHPEICATYDMNEDLSIISREKIIALSKDNKLTMGGMHFPAPGFYDGL